MKSIVFIAVLLGGGAITIGLNVWAQPSASAAAQPQGDASSSEADREAIIRSARSFADAFNKSDAKAIGVLWTENAELRDASGATYLGRTAIEKAYADFFKSNPGSKIEVLVKSIRFPAKDLAVEEGLVRSSRGPKDLPATAAYVALQVREGGQWKIALSSESGAGQNRLEDLDWLLGDWVTKVKDATVKMSFARDAKAPRIVAAFTRTAPGKEPTTASSRIAFDPETGQLRSWGFEDDGAHWQALWNCDGKSWVLDCRGVLADGTPTAERMVLQRVSPDVITWRSIDRVVGDAALPDTTPMRLTRTSNPK